MSEEKIESLQVELEACKAELHVLRNKLSKQIKEEKDTSEGLLSHSAFYKSVLRIVDNEETASEIMSLVCAGVGCELTISSLKIECGDIVLETLGDVPREGMVNVTSSLTDLSNLKSIKFPEFSVDSDAPVIVTAKIYPFQSKTFNIKNIV